ncbi:uncharacterized protein LOC143904700 [Temnothorax americanus]|uniref:uncharacterized protein LOC143904700 n=1 Tax=Temnothorax americanus TaxID=1964332 RepID=UPI0040677B5B
MANSLARILPNIGGASGHVRRLYVATVHSVLLYGAPIWWEKVGGSTHLNAKMAAAQRIIALRAARAYRTVSHMGATALAEIPPMRLLAKSYAKMYETASEIRRVHGTIPPKAKRALRLRIKEALLQDWKAYLADLLQAQQPRKVYGRRVLEAVQPILEEWLGGSKKRFAAFHAAQVITGHGCFGDYLCRIGKERTTRCHYCPEAVDTAQHTLEVCPAWDAERRVLGAAIGQDFSLPAVLAAVAVPGENGRERWKKFVSFCEAVMSRKEADERIRRGEVSPPASSGRESSDDDGSD